MTGDLTLDRSCGGIIRTQRCVHQGCTFPSFSSRGSVCGPAHNHGIRSEATKSLSRLVFSLTTTLTSIIRKSEQESKVCPLSSERASTTTSKTHAGLLVLGHGRWGGPDTRTEARHNLRVRHQLVTVSAFLHILFSAFRRSTSKLAESRKRG